MDRQITFHGSHQISARMLCKDRFTVSGLVSVAEVAAAWGLTKKHAIAVMGSSRDITLPSEDGALRPSLGTLGRVKPLTNKVIQERSSISISASNALVS